MSGKPEADRRCMILLTARIAAGEPLTADQIIDLSYALQGHFSDVSHNDESEDVQKAARLFSQNVRRVSDELGIPPGYLDKYESGVSPIDRAERVRSAYRIAKQSFGIDKEPGFEWREGK